MNTFSIVMNEYGFQIRFLRAAWRTKLSGRFLAFLRLKWSCGQPLLAKTLLVEILNRIRNFKLDSSSMRETILNIFLNYLWTSITCLRFQYYWKMHIFYQNLILELLIQVVTRYVCIHFNPILFTFCAISIFSISRHLNMILK